VIIRAQEQHSEVYAMVVRNAGISARLALMGLVGIGSIPALMLSAIVVDRAVAQDVDTNKETPTPFPEPAPGGALLLPGEGPPPELPPKAVLEHEPLAPAHPPGAPGSNDEPLRPPLSDD